MTHERLNVLSLFDGMSGGQIALKELGIIPDVYYASEIDRHAMKQTQLNFPNTVQLGSVVDVDVSKLEPINLLLGGSPCQSFSFAGKRNGMSTVDNEEIYTLERYLELKSEGFEFVGESYLFWEYMRILTDIRKYNPDVLFLLENVEMGKKWERVLSEAIGIYGVHINSNLVSAQNRARVYWTNIRTRREGLFGELHSDIPQPEDEGIFLRDILENEADEKYYLSEKIIKTLSTRCVGYNFNITDGNNKSGCIRKDVAKMGTTDTYIKLDTKGNKRRNQDKSSCITGASGHGAGNHSDMDLICISSKQSNATVSVNKSTPMVAAMGMGGGHVPMGCVAMRGRDAACLTPRRTEYGKQIRKQYESGSITEQRKNIQQLEPRDDGKTNTITSVQKDNLVIQLNPSTESGGKQPYQQNRVYADYGKSPAHMAQLSCGAYAVETKSRIRRLTPTEVARLQTVPDWYKWECSDTQIYKMCGNGWTIKVIQHILSFMNLNK